MLVYEEPLPIIRKNEGKPPKVGITGAWLAVKGEQVILQARGVATMITYRLPVVLFSALALAGCAGRDVVDLAHELAQDPATVFIQIQGMGGQARIFRGITSERTLIPSTRRQASTMTGHRAWWLAGRPEPSPQAPPRLSPEDSRPSRACQTRRRSTTTPASRSTC